ncbi:hypothetical protein ABFS83_05G047800 [Erythranthe nasuta]
MDLYGANQVYVSVTEQFLKEFQEALDYAKTNLAIYFHPCVLKYVLNKPFPPHLSAMFVDVDVGVDANCEKLKQMKLQQRQQQVEVKQILKMVYYLLDPRTNAVSGCHKGDIMSTIRCYVNQVNIALESYKNKFDAVGNLPNNDFMSTMVQMFQQLHVRAPNSGTHDDCVPMMVQMFQQLQLHALDCDLGQQHQ